MLHRKTQVWSRVSIVAFWAFTLVNGVAVIWGKLPVFENEFGSYQAVRLAGKAHGDLAVFICSIGLFVSALAVRIFGRMSTWDTLHSLISDLRPIMVDPDNDNPTVTKATIFKASKVCYIDGWWKRLICRFKTSPRWLVPIVRSNHLNQHTKTCFAIGDDTDTCEGVTGQAWAQERILFATLPDVSEENPYPKTLSQYTSRGHVTVEWIKKHRPTCRTVLAIPLVVAGKHWGVLVFHSKTAGKIEFSDIEPIARVIQKHVIQLLSKHL